MIVVRPRGSRAAASFSLVRLAVLAAATPMVVAVGAALVVMVLLIAVVAAPLLLALVALLVVRHGRVRRSVRLHLRVIVPPATSAPPGPHQVAPG